MKKEIIEFKFVLLILILVFSLSGITAQTILEQDSLIRIKKVKIFPIANPPPTYIIEIKNDMTISFYFNIPKNFSKNHSGFKGIYTDSTTININSSDFFELEKTINGIDINNINTPKKIKSQNEVAIKVAGYFPDNYFIETSYQKIKFSNDIYDADTTNSSIINMFEKLEDKYKPKK